MPTTEAAIDRILASVLKGQPVPLPAALASREAEGQLRARILYHGIAGLLAERLDQIQGWPYLVIAAIREQAIAQAMWELRHREQLRSILAALASREVAPILMKGTAIAYDLYANPAARARGDSDLLVRSEDLDTARAALAEAGFRRSSGMDGNELQECWASTDAHGLDHLIDLHWQVLNAPALRDVLTYQDFAQGSRALAALADSVRGPGLVVALLHSCVHRGLNVTAPYMVDGDAHFGGDRLIWAYDIKLQAAKLSPAEWKAFAELAVRRGVAAASLDALQAAREQVDAGIPTAVVTELKSGSDQYPTAAYFSSALPASRAWHDLRAVPGVAAKLAFVVRRLFPAAAFMRGKYPGMNAKPLPLLYLRRAIELFRPRPRKSRS